MWLRYGSDAGYRQAGIQALTYIVHASGSLNVPSLEPEARAEETPAAEARAGTRPVVFTADGPVDTPIYQRPF